ncbi:hypothetical protein GBA63_08205 [Rubrobacter tropicus]|uniref:histidine kinase n=1 Tax=Rubrobacter tropicus TaxID=2653851 RepID=A0A6G8Q827_9ACTN|nr:ATP-binding protein [Rubrobacter tropicus]QIN82626.1 hypothetical protein GBA63_08205 [Rubrobacter tropicus]
MGWIKKTASQPWLVAVVAGSLIAMIALAGLVGLMNNLYVKKITDGGLEHAVQLETRSSNLRDAVSELQFHHRDLLLYGPVEEHVQDIDRAYDDVIEQIDLLDSLGVRDPEAPQPDSLRRMANAYYEGFKPVADRQASDPGAFELASDRGLAQLAELDRAAVDLEARGQDRAAEALVDLSAAEDVERIVLILVATGLVLALIALTYTGWRMMLLIGELRGLHAEQRAAAEARADFLADVSHELRTPLTVLRSNAEFGLAIDKDWAHRDVLEEVVKESVHMSRMVEDLLFLARSDTSSPPMETRPVSVPLFVADLAGRSEVLAREHGSRFETGLEGEGEIRIDPSRMEQAVLALVDNAAKYGPVGGLVSLTSSTDGGELRIEVADEGPGIPREELERIFERFHRVGGTRSRRAGGSGLGLSIAKSIVELHGGRIEAQAPPGGGTRMTVCLPLDHAAKPAPGPAVEAPGREGGTVGRSG